MQFGASSEDVDRSTAPYFRNTVVFDVEHGLLGFGPCG